MDWIPAPEEYRTERFVLRSWRPGDGPALSDAVNPSYDHLKTFMPWATDSQTPEQSEKLVRQFRGRYLLATDFVVAVFHPAGHVLGGTGFHLRCGPLAHRQAEVGMWISSAAAGQGLGTDVLSAMVRWGFSEWPWERLVWRCHVDNIASRRVAEKVGMTLEGLSHGEYSELFGRRDTANYAIVKEQP